jgi:battenin
MTLDSASNANEEFSTKNAKIAFAGGKRFIINLFTVYFLEYAILTGFGDRVKQRGYITDIDKKFQYESFQLCYQIGVFISRSCLFLLKHVKHIEILTMLQLVSFVLWFFNVYFGFMSNLVVVAISLVIVGLMGGGSYVYCYSKILESTEIKDEFKELTVNIGTIFNDCGILLCSIFVLILDNTIMT